MKTTITTRKLDDLPKSELVAIVLYLQSCLTAALERERELQKRYCKTVAEHNYPHGDPAQIARQNHWPDLFAGEEQGE